MGQIVDEFTEAILYVNGVRRVLPDGLAHMTLLEYLRGSFSLSIFYSLVSDYMYEVLDMI